MSAIHFNGAFDTADVTNMMSMFNGCRNIRSLDLSSFNTARVKKMSSMFKDCKKLTTLHVRNWNTCPIDTKDMFKGCSLPREVVSAILSDETVST